MNKGNKMDKANNAPQVNLIWVGNSSLSGDVYSSPDSSFQTTPVSIVKVLDFGIEIEKAYYNSENIVKDQSVDLTVQLTAS